MTLTLEFDLDTVKLNQHTNVLTIMLHEKAYAARAPYGFRGIRPDSFVDFGAM